GITVGEVKSLNIEINKEQNGFIFPIGIELYPGRLTSIMTRGSAPLAMDEQGRRVRWDAMVAKGLRGQLRTGNLLTGQLYVAIDFFPDAREATMDWTANPPVIPTISGGLEEFQSTLNSIAKKIEKMPIGEISADVRQALQSLNRTLVSADLAVKRLDK